MQHGTSVLVKSATPKHIKVTSPFLSRFCTCIMSGCTCDLSTKLQAAHMIEFQHSFEWTGCHVAAGVVQSNIVNTCNWSLTEEEYAAITGIKHQLRLLDGCPWLHEVGPYRYLQPVTAPPNSTSCIQSVCFCKMLHTGDDELCKPLSSLRFCF